jgi:1,4-dihydroxy-2-naphthoate octaprenyltransferase
LNAGTLLKAVRAPSLTAGAMPVLTANALVAHQGFEVDLGVLGVTLLGMIAAQAGVNLVNDYFDDRSGLDADPEFAHHPFPLGSRVIQQGALSRGGVVVFALVCFAVAAVCCFVLDRRYPGHVVLRIALVGALLGYFYTAPPLRIAYRGAGEPVTFLLFGPLAGAGAYYVQTGLFDGTAILLSTVVGLLAMAILFLHHFPQYEADRRHGKNTPIVRLGPETAGKWVPWLLGAPYVLVLAGVVVRVFPEEMLVFFLTLPWSIRVSRTALDRAAEPRPMSRAVGNVLLVHFVGGLAITLALWLG